jgi:hypothetical protein
MEKGRQGVVRGGAFLAAQFNQSIERWHRTTPRGTVWQPLAICGTIENGGNGGNRWKWWKGLETVEKNKVTHFHVSTNLIWQAIVPGGDNAWSLCRAGWIESECQEVPLSDTDVAGLHRRA